MIELTQKEVVDAILEAAKKKAGQNTALGSFTVYGKPFGVSYNYKDANSKQILLIDSVTVDAFDVTPIGEKRASFEFWRIGDYAKTVDGRRVHATGGDFEEIVVGTKWGLPVFMSKEEYMKARVREPEASCSCELLAHYNAICTTCHTRALHAKASELFARRVPIEQRLLDAATGKLPLPTKEECRELALKLGTPDVVKSA